jgi:4-amino-4-deoxy-L-arabinose transferase-like glycosyltransferase
MKRFMLRSALSALALLALAFFLRVYRLGDKNIWWDEGWTVWMAQHDFSWIALRTASDEHPPLHYWLMNVWQTITGPDAFTGRFFSLLFGVLLVALVYRLGKDIGGARLGLLAALFLGLARFNVWWSQDIKNYTLSASFAWVSVWAVQEIVFSETDLRRKFVSEKTIWIMYILATATALYSHYLAALIVLANNVFVLILLLAKWRRGENCIPLLVRWSLAQIGVLLLFAPWLYVYLQNGATWTAAPAFDFGLFLRLAATVLTLGVTTYIENYTWIVLGIVLIAALSLGWLVRRPASQKSSAGPVVSASPSSVLRPPSSLAWGAVHMLVITLLPPALIYVLSLTPAAIFAPKIQARYLMMLTPAVAMLLGLGILFLAETFRSRAGRIISAALTVLVVVAQLYTLDDYFRERYLRDEYFSVAQMINNFGFDDDVIVLNTDQEYPTFLYYLKRPFAWVGVPNGAPVNEATAQRVAAEALRRDAVWVVSIPDALQKDPTRLLEQTLAQRLQKQYEQSFGDKRLALYTNAVRNVKDVPPESFTPQVSRSDVFDERLKLVGVDLPVREVSAGDIVRVVTYWESQDLTTLNVSLRNGDQVLATSSIPISIGARERAQADLQVPPDLGRAVVPGTPIHIVAQARLREQVIGELDFRSSPGTPPTITDEPAVLHTERFGDSIRLIGVTPPGETFRAGENVPITLFWQTDAPLSASYTVFVHLLGEQYNPAQNNFLWGQVDRLPLDGRLPTTAWSPDQTIPDAYQVKLDERVPKGKYKIEIGLYDSSGTRLRVFDANGKDLGDALIAGEVQVGDE